MPRCSATFKMAIRFVDWLAPPDDYYHPFMERPEPVLSPWGAPYFPMLGRGVSRIHLWHERHLRDPTLEYARTCIPAARLCDAMRAPRHPDRPELERASAYHLDAARLADVLAELACSRGVLHREGKVVGVERDDGGDVTRIRLDDGGELPGDLFVDCTGFGSLLLGRELSEPFLSDSASLLCDSAVAIQVPEETGPGTLRPYTRATAVSSGWIWQVPLLHRQGTGYVYSRTFQDPGAAEEELRTFLGIGHELPARHIRMRIGRSRRSWVRNVVAIGLSSCFLEPLESTGIFLVEYQLAMLLALFPDRSMPGPLQDRYNRLVAERYEELRDFIVLHYILTRREDTAFWRAVRSETRVPDTLAEKLAFAEVGLPVLDDIQPPIFRDVSWTAILAGMDRLPPSRLPLLAHLDPAFGDGLIADLVAEADALVAAMPDHYRYLMNVTGP